MIGIIEHPERDRWITTVLGISLVEVIIGQQGGRQGRQSSSPNPNSGHKYLPLRG